MPITIPVPTPPAPISPGNTFRWSSDFIGPTPGDLRLFVSVTSDTEGLNVMTATSYPVQDQRSGQVPFFTDKTIQWGHGEHAAAAGAQVLVKFSLTSDTIGEVDQGNTVMIWEPASGQALVSQLYTGGGGTGLTAEQSQQLLETNQATHPSIPIDALSLVALTTGPDQGPINAFLPNPTFGVIIRIATVPPELVPTTPDGDYWVKSLAVCRIFRGSDLWKRVPIHTSSKLVELLDESIVAGLTAVTATQWLLNLSVQVTFLEGVTGEVFTMLLP